MRNKPWYTFLFLFSLSLLISCNSREMDLTNFDVQGHRGCRGIMPENTIQGFIHALDLGVHTLEMDLVISQDSQVIVSHEAFFNHEISLSPNGDTISKDQELDFNLYKMSLSEIQAFDVGQKIHPRFPLQTKLKVVKPTLSSVIDTVESYILQNKLRRIKYNLEIKRIPEQDEIFHPKVDVFVDLVMKTIFEKDIQEYVIIQSFDVETLKILRIRYPEIQIAFLTDDMTQNISQNIETLGFKPDFYSPHYRLVSQPLVNYCKRNNIKLIPWTVNTEKEILKLIKLEVDGIITDFPDMLIEIITSKSLLN